MKEKFILQPGKVCTFDCKNSLEQDENGIIFVEIVEEIPKKSLFGPRWFTIKGTGDDDFKLPNPIEVPETALKPEGMVVIRNPANFPTINNLDVEALASILKFIDNPLDNQALININNKKIIDRLRALHEKLDFFSRITEV